MIAKNRKLTAAMVAAGVLSASMLVGQVHAQVAPAVSNTGTGSAVVVPYYTINEGWFTLLNVTNTSGNSLAVKVRLHEGRNSRDVLDFNLALSPYDVWTAVIERGPDGRPFLRTNDTSCTIPISVRDSGASASELAYSRAPGFADFRDHTGTDNDISRMSEGYVEILVMGETVGEGLGGSVTDTVANRTGDTAWYAKHVNGVPRNCDIVENDFRRGSTIPAWTGGPVTGADGSGDPIARGGAYGYGPIDTPAPLKVNASLINIDRGMAAGVESLHVSGFGFSEGENGSVGQNLVTAQQFPWFLEPTLASSDGLWTITGLDAISDGIAALSVINEWASNPNTGANSDWVVTFPTKRFHADNHATNMQAACSQWRNLAAGGGTIGGTTTAYSPVVLGGAAFINECPLAPFENRFQAGDDGRSNITVTYDIFDREEGTVRIETDGVVISPAPPPEVTIDTLPYEVNVLKVGRDAANAPSGLNSPTALAIDTTQLVSNSNVGWMEMSFGTGDAAKEIPVTGFVFKLRDFGDASLNFAQSTEHGYTRSD